MLKVKTKRLTTKKQILALVSLGLLMFISRAHPLVAQGVTQGYGTDEQLERGMIVMLKKEDPTKVELVTSTTTERMHGVTVSANDAPVTLSEDGQKVFVATIGRYDLLVNDQNGDIKTGDYLTISAIKGIGMKVDTIQPLIIGKALADFNGKDALSTATIKNSRGDERKVNVGRIAVDIGVGRNPNQKAVANVPEVLRRATEEIAGKPVNALRTYLSVIVFIVSIVVTGSILYAGVRNAIISIGRNPLSKKSIYRGLAQVILTSLIIFTSGLFGVYLLLKI